VQPPRSDQDQRKDLEGFGQCYGAAALKRGSADGRVIAVCRALVAAHHANEMLAR
jgi:hypothetical protein